MRQSLISVPNFFGSWIQSCTKLVGTHALLIIITFIIKMYVYKMTCMIQYPCSKHASSPSLPHQAMLVYTCLLFIPSALSLTTLILGSGEQSFYYTMSQQFRTRLLFCFEEIGFQIHFITSSSPSSTPDVYFITFCFHTSKLVWSRKFVFSPTLIPTPFHRTNCQTIVTFPPSALCYFLHTPGAFSIHRSRFRGVCTHVIFAETGLLTVCGFPCFSS